jgi:hypothetical protein
MEVLSMRALRAVSYGIVLIAPGLIAACANSTTSLAVNSGKYYAVSAARAAFYRYGPQQGNGPDQKLPHDTLVTLIQPTFGYCKVQLMSGEQGYVASEDIHPASAQLVAAATTKPSVTPTNRASRSRLNPNDPRLTTPPEPLPLDLPEPTPIPETQSSPH